MTATGASRKFSDLLDAIERGETVVITRGGHAVAEIRPPRRRTGADLRAALAGAADRSRALAAIISVMDVLDYTETTAAHHARLIAHARRPERHAAHTI